MGRMNIRFCRDAPDPVLCSRIRLWLEQLDGLRPRIDDRRKATIEGEYGVEVAEAAMQFEVWPGMLAMRFPDPDVFCTQSLMYVAEHAYHHRDWHNVVCAVREWCAANQAPLASPPVSRESAAARFTRQAVEAAARREEDLEHWRGTVRRLCDPETPATARLEDVQRRIYAVDQLSRFSGRRGSPKQLTTVDPRVLAELRKIEQELIRQIGASLATAAVQCRDTVASAYAGGEEDATPEQRDAALRCLEAAGPSAGTRARRRPADFVGDVKDLRFVF